MSPERSSGDRGLPRVAVLIALGAVAGALVWGTMTLLVGSGAPPKVPPIRIDTTPAVRDTERLERQRRRAAERRREAAPPPAPALPPPPVPDDDDVDDDDGGAD